MKVIGEAGTDYICIVKHSEIEKFFNLYYNKFNRLKIGEEIDLGRGYEWSADINKAFENTKKFIETNRETIKSIVNGLTIYQSKLDNNVD